MQYRSSPGAKGKMMEEQTVNLSDYLSAFKRRRLSIFLIAATIFTIGALVAVFTPPTYTSSATILIKEQDIPPELVRSTVTSFASQRIQAISQKVMARPNLLKIINQFELYKKKLKRLTTEEIISEMRENISLEMIDADVVDPRSGRPMAATIAFRLSFSSDNPVKAQQVANELMSLYLKENLKERTEQASETYLFLKDESGRLSKEIGVMEAEIAAFKESHANSLPELLQLNMELMTRTERELEAIDSQIRSQEERKVYLSGQLAQIKPYGTDVALDPATRLQALRTQYFALAARYSEDHPDVIRMRKEIQGLEEETGDVDSSAEQLQQIEAMRSELAILKKKYAPEHPDVVKLERQIKSLEANVPDSTSKLTAKAADNPDNPIYIQMQSQIEAANLEIRTLEKKKLRLRDKLAEYEQRLVETPQAEREYQSLQRSLQNAISEYQNIRTKLVAAQIGQELEKDSKGERFQIIEPPVRPEKPISPNRPAILFLSFVLALGCGIGYAAVRESMDDTVRSSKTLTAAAGITPLAVIPYLKTDAETRKRKQGLVMRAAATAAAIILAVTLFHYFWTPLDVLWYKVLRKADTVVNT